MEEKKIKKILEEYKKETKRHFDVVAEKIEDKIALVAEQVAANTEKLKEHDKRFNKIDDTLEVIKLDIEFIKNELKQKVGRDEFAALEKRVSLLEAKVNKLK
jgi:DNA-binding ferritin-like protein